MYQKRLQALTCFYVFNPSLAPKETDDETKKILYFFPSKTMPLHTQCAYVGLVTGICNFSKDFASEPCHTLHTERNRYVFDEVEKDIWITLVLKNPRKDLKTDKYGRRQPISDPDAKKKEKKKNDDDDANPLPTIDSEYFMDDELEDNVLHTIIRSAYSTFVFFHGTFDHIVSTETQNTGDPEAGWSRLREHLRTFFKYYLPTIQFHQLRYYADIYGFRFFAVDRTTYLTLQYLNNIVKSEFNQLHSLCVMYSGKLIWSGLDQDDMRVLYTNNQEPNDSYIYTFMAKKASSSFACSLTADHRKSRLNSMASQSSMMGAAAASSHSKSGNNASGGGNASSLSALDAAASGSVMEGEFLTGPKSKEYWSEQSPIVYLSRRNRFYRLICYKLRKLKFFWLCNDETLVQPLNASHDDIYGHLNMMSNLDLDRDIGQQMDLEEKKQSAIKRTEKGKEEVKGMVIRNVSDPDWKGNGNGDEMKEGVNRGGNGNGNGKEENVRKVSMDYGPLADDVTEKYFPSQKSRKNAHDETFEMEQERVVQFYEKIQNFIEPHAEEIIKELERHEQRQNRNRNKQHSQSNFRFLYFNHQNLALKSILKAPGKKLSSDTCRTLRNIHADFEGSGLAISEVCAKCSDGWVVARKSHFAGRELYLLVDHSEAPELKDLQAHMDALQEEYFSNIFMY